MQVLVLLGLLWPSLQLSLLSSAFDKPFTWRSPSFNATRDQRIAVAHGTMDLVAQNITSLGLLGTDPHAAIPTLNSLILSDLMAGTTHYKQSVTQGYKDLYTSGYPTSIAFATYNELLLTWAIGLIYGHRAYGDPFFLPQAERQWAIAYPYLVTEADAAARAHPFRNVSISDKCTTLNFTSAGAVLLMKNFTMNLNDTTVTPGTVGQFATLSAYLAEETKNATYLQTALLSATFLRDVMTDISGLVFNSVTLHDCRPILESSDESEIASGYAIQAWAAVAAATNDTKWRDQATQTMLASTTSLLWSGINGVLDFSHTPGLVDPSIKNSHPEGSVDLEVITGYKGMYVSSLYELWKGNSDNATLSDYIRSFIAVQYNALQDLATKPGSNYYSADWNGPASSQWSSGGVMASTPVLAMAIGPGPDPPASNASSTASAPASTISQADTSDGSTASSHHRSVGVIVGPILGILAALMGLGLYLILRRRRSRQAEMEHVDHFAEKTNPVLEEAAPTSPTSTANIPRSRSKRQETAMRSGEHAPDALPAVPEGANMSTIVELLYQRIQADRPAASEGSEVGQAPPAYVPNQSSLPLQPNRYVPEQ